jgi:dinuclear metal center YbgI/SA1388 family protein
MDELYPPAWAESWDAVGLVLGDPAAEVGRVLLVVDVVPETAAEAAEVGADMIISHHPLLFRGVTSVAPVNYKGRIVHDLIRSGTALHVAHTNADIAENGVCAALADLLGLVGALPLLPRADNPVVGLGRVGSLPAPVSLGELTAMAAAVLPATAWGVRAAGDPDRVIRTLAVVGGSGSDTLEAVAAAGVDALLTSDIKHHYGSEHISEGGPAIIEAAHWATEWPWLPRLGAALRKRFGIEIIVSGRCTDPWTLHEPSNTDRDTKGVPA